MKTKGKTRFLHNRVEKNLLREKLMQEPFQRITISFYRYVYFEKPEAIRDQLFAEWDELDIFGRIYIAHEGINAQMSVPEHGYDQFLKTLYAHPYFKDIPIKVAVEDDGKSFYKLTIKVRPKLVNDGLEDHAFDVTNVGQHLDADGFNAAVQDPNTIVVDMRNHYEYEVGHFEGAIGPDGATFRDVLPEMVEKLKGQEDKKVILYCTGGIRCEKASAYFRHHGFQDVNQLHGGIIDYSRQIKVKELDNKYLGKNFVFDERLAERISDDVLGHCYQCGKPADTHVNCANEACHILFVQCDECRGKYEGCCSERCLEFTHLSVEEQGPLYHTFPRFQLEDGVYMTKQKEVLRNLFPYYPG